MDQRKIKTINTTNGTPYVGVVDNGDTFMLQLHRYNRVGVTFDKSVLPELIKHLTDLNYERTI